MTDTPAFDIRYDVASAIDQGQRDYQEDALVTDFPIGSQIGFAVLADGMGGHAAGDVASKIIVTEVFSELKLQSGMATALAQTLPEILKTAAHAANACLRGHVDENPNTNGMGATLLAPVFIEDRLFWISVGDSPLFLFRNGTLQQINEDHSMAPQIDFMVQRGLLQADLAKNHPDRNCLTSVLFGDAIPRIDCPETPLQLEEGDVVVAASDGLQYLSNEVIAGILNSNPDAQSAEIAEALLDAIRDLGDPDQDNIALSVVRLRRHQKKEAQTTPPHMSVGARIWPWPRKVAEPTMPPPADAVASGGQR